jgi:hypothetical protein
VEFSWHFPLSKFKSTTSKTTATWADWALKPKPPLPKKLKSGITKDKAAATKKAKASGGAPSTGIDWKMPDSDVELGWHSSTIRLWINSKRVYLKEHHSDIFPNPEAIDNAIYLQFVKEQKQNPEFKFSGGGSRSLFPMRDMFRNTPWPPTEKCPEPQKGAIVPRAVICELENNTICIYSIDLISEVTQKDVERALKKTNDNLHFVWCHTHTSNADMRYSKLQAGHFTYAPGVTGRNVPRELTLDFTFATFIAINLSVSNVTLEYFQRNTDLHDGHFWEMLHQHQVGLDLHVSRLTEVCPCTHECKEKVYAKQFNACGLANVELLKQLYRDHYDPCFKTCGKTFFMARKSNAMQKHRCIGWQTQDEKGSQELVGKRRGVLGPEKQDLDISCPLCLTLRKDTSGQKDGAWDKHVKNAHTHRCMEVPDIKTWNEQVFKTQTGAVQILGEPFSWPLEIEVGHPIHPADTKRLKVQEVTGLNNMFGVFAKSKLDETMQLQMYCGEYFDDQDLRFDSMPFYTYGTYATEVNDASGPEYFDTVARYINHRSHPSNNVKFVETFVCKFCSSTVVPTTQKPFICTNCIKAQDGTSITYIPVVTRAIKKNEQLFCDYGPEYLYKYNKFSQGAQNNSTGHIHTPNIDGTYIALAREEGAQESVQFYLRKMVDGSTNALRATKQDNTITWNLIQSYNDASNLIRSEENGGKPPITFNTPLPDIAGSYLTVPNIGHIKIVRYGNVLRFEKDQPTCVRYIKLGAINFPRFDSDHKFSNAHFDGGSDDWDGDSDDEGGEDGSDITCVECGISDQNASVRLSLLNSRETAKTWLSNQGYDHLDTEQFMNELLIKGENLSFTALDETLHLQKRLGPCWDMCIKCQNGTVRQRLGLDRLSNNQIEDVIKELIRTNGVSMNGMPQYGTKISQFCYYLKNGGIFNSEILTKIASIVKKTFPGGGGGSASGESAPDESEYEDDAMEAALALIKFNPPPSAPPVLLPEPTTPDLYAKVIDHVTWPDDCVIMPEEVGNKQWEVKNTGKLSWPEDTKLVNISGNMPRCADTDGKIDSYEIGALDTGKTATIGVCLRAPTDSPVGDSQWQLQSNSTGFGEFLTCRIIVRGEEADAEFLDQFLDLGN